jgi:hypothetical protein
MKDIQLYPVVLALYPFSRGFAFVFLQDPESPFEWGVKEIKGNLRNHRSIEEMRNLIERYRPELIVIEDKSPRKRPVRIQRIYRSILNIAKSNHIEVHRCSKKEIAAFFARAGAKTKSEIASAVAVRIKAFSHRLPPIRKPWNSEDPRQSLFDAAALALTYYWKAKGSPKEGD